MNKLLTLLCVAPLLVVPAVSPAGQDETAAVKAQATGPEQLVGQWVLNKAESDIPKRPEGGRRGGPPGGPGGGMGGPGDGMGGPGGGMGGYGGGMGGHGGGMGGPGGGPGGEHGGRPGGSDPVAGASSLMVQLEGLELKLVSGEGRVRTITIDSQPVERQRGRMTVTETASFRDGQVQGRLRLRPGSQCEVTILSG